MIIFLQNMVYYYKGDTKMELIKFVRVHKKGQNKKVGALVALSSKQIGWSKCNKKDDFSEEIALNLARGRALHTPSKVPNSLHKEYLSMVLRAHRYFKQEPLRKEA